MIRKISLTPLKHFQNQDTDASNESEKDIDCQAVADSFNFDVPCKVDQSNVPDSQCVEGTCERSGLACIFYIAQHDQLTVNHILSYKENRKKG